ncbi:MAG: class I SAM-dependent methyltransferase [Rhodospirillales bacterium]|nr:class I SAM-dependent methyltransferase [Rhodospirillales bacterium]
MTEDAPVASDVHEAVRLHYQAGIEVTDFPAQLKTLIDALGTGPEVERQIAQLDHFHVRGRAATAELAALAAVGPGMKVLDAGSGLGGPSRYLATELGCEVVGVDLSPAFVAIATMLAERAGVSDRVRYEVGNVGELTFGDASFDLVWSEHVMMNLQDRISAYRGFHRTLRSEGRFAFYEPIAIEGADSPHYPTPWAEKSDESYLLTHAQIEKSLEAAGFGMATWKDAAEDAIQAFANQAPPDPSALGLSTIMGPRFPAMAMNFARNIREGRIGLVMGVATKRG